MYFPLRGSQTTIWLFGSKPVPVSLAEVGLPNYVLTLEGQLADLEALMRALLGRDDRCITNQWVVNAGVWDQIGLELVQVDVERTVKAQTGGNGADNLSNQAIEVLVVGTRNIQAAAADIVDSLVID
jgi:hypothetical protein